VDVRRVGDCRQHVQVAAHHRNRQRGTELAALGSWRGERQAAPAVPSQTASSTSSDADIRLATWHQLLDAGRMQDGEPYLAGTARDVVARVSAATATAAGIADGDKVTVATGAGSVTVPLEVVPMADGTVWLPVNSPGCAVRADLGAMHGSRVTLRRAQ